jgi:DNA-directed RNA polymerase specialized sigma24 family protein
MLSEQKLVAQFLNGEPDAEEKFYTMFYPRLFRLSMQLLGGNKSGAARMAQRTFADALVNLDRHNSQVPIYPHLRLICVRLCYARLRQGRDLSETPGAGLKPSSAAAPSDSAS